jgi:hypothetical protein
MSFRRSSLEPPNALIETLMPKRLLPSEIRNY